MSDLRMIGAGAVGSLLTILYGFAGGWCWDAGFGRGKSEGTPPPAAAPATFMAATAAPCAVQAPWPPQQAAGSPLPSAGSAPVAGVNAQWPPQHRSNGTVIRQPWVSGGKEDPCVPAPHNVPPRGDYVYHSSDLEKEWIDGARFGQICSTAKKQKELAAIWTSYTSSVLKTNRRPTREPTEHEVLSYFEYPQPDGTRVKRYIEPLHGIARHPTCTCFDRNPGYHIFDLTYLLPDNACTESGNRVTGVFFDLGAGTNVGGFERMSDYSNGNADGGSIPLFHRMYYDRCIDFRAIYAWEVRGIDHKTFWGPLPDDVRGRFHLYNAPVAENDCPASPEGRFTERGSFLRLLKSTVSVDDYVVLKVDIDHGPELQIVESIAHIPELSELVDELYFEYHFKFSDVPNHPWDTKPNRQYGGKTVDTAINLMLRLRQAGIRAHFWV